MEAIILAGGFGTRLAHMLEGIPKPMAEVAGRPFLEYVLDDLVKQGVKRIVLAVCYEKEVIIKHFSDNYKGAEILYSVEDTPLLTGGAIKKAMSLVEGERFFVVNGDTYFPVDLSELGASRTEEDSTSVVIAVKEMRDFSRYGRVVFEENGIVTDFLEKEPCDCGHINGGVYDIPKEVLQSYPESFSLEELCFPQLLKEKKILASVHEDFFIDIGVPEDFLLAQDIFSNNKEKR